MKKEAMIDAYATYYNTTKKEARLAIERMPDFITRVLKDSPDHECTFRGYMTFSAHAARPRKYYNAGVGKFFESSGGATKINCKISKTMKQLVGKLGDK